MPPAATTAAAPPLLALLPALLFFMRSAPMTWFETVSSFGRRATRQTVFLLEDWTAAYILCKGSPAVVEVDQLVPPG